MERLTPTDSLFLSVENRVTPMHVGGLLTLDTTNARDFGFEQVRDLFMRRMARVPKYTWKLKEVPFNFDRPFWTDGDLNIDQHFGRITVAPPAGPREIATALGDVMSQPLDRGLPLWRMWYLDWLADGIAALYTTYHHCLMDGTSGASLSNVILDLEPNPEPDTPDEPAGPGGRNSSDLEHVLASGLSMMATPLRLAEFVGGLARRVADLAPELVRHGVPAAVLSRPPRTSFNSPVGTRRTMAFAAVSLADTKSVRKRLGVTVNDVLIALCAAAMERYMNNIDETESTRPLALAVPISMRAPGDLELTNRVSTLLVTVPTGIDPIERLRAISSETTRGKQLARAFTTRLPSVGGFVPPIVLSATMKAATPLFPWMPVLVNAIVSTVNGAPVPLYVAGARVTGTYPTSILMANMGMNFTAISLEDHVDIGITVDPKLVPDPWLVADAIPEALEALMHAAGLGDPQPMRVLAVA